MLVAPLDWGLGHATRCIPIIEKLLNAGFKVIMAAEGDQKILLQTAYPELEMINLKGYRLRYGSTKWRTIIKIIFQIPKILTAINEENDWLRGLIKDKHLAAVVADNRFGLYNKKTVSIFITHQLHIKTLMGKLADAIVRKLNYRFINRFDFCWVPDAPDAENLAGELSHPAMKPRTAVIYTGLLSRIKKQNIPVSNKLLLLLSGPEPQRSILEKILLAQLVNYTQPAILVRGLPGATDIIASSSSLSVYNYLPGPQLQQVINQSDIIISRSGYSTVMDILPLGKKCIFIPTPGQAEQEYLAAYLAGKNYACTAFQHNFSLPAMIEKAEKFKPQHLAIMGPSGGADHAIERLLSLLNNKQ